MKNALRHTSNFLIVIKAVLLSPTFLTLSLIGNFIVLSFSSLIYFFEKDTNSSIKTFSDSLWFCFSTASTVGYGDLTPESTIGRILGVLLMLIGVALFGIYTSLFANAIINKRK